MDDPTTLGLNLTFFGTLGVAFLMLLVLGFLIAVTLVLAGIAKLIWVILLALVGVYPKRSTGTVVHLPPPPRHMPSSPALLEEAGPSESQTVHPLPEEPRPGFIEKVRHAAGTVGIIASAGVSTLRNVQWKSLLSPRAWPKPGQVKAGIAATASALATSQAKEHPFVVAARQDPPVLNSKWAAAVAEADAREAARRAERERQAERERHAAEGHGAEREGHTAEQAAAGRAKAARPTSPSN
ncbi:hypothetical protein AB6813_18160 [bacterium RCC_150]